MNNKFIQLTTFECTNINGGGALGVIGGVLMCGGAIISGGGILAVGVGVVAGIGTIITSW